MNEYLLRQTTALLHGTPPREKTKPPVELWEALGVESKYVGQNKFDYLVEVESEEIVSAIKPDFMKLMKVPTRGVIQSSERGVILRVKVIDDRVIISGKAVTVLEGELYI